MAAFIPDTLLESEQNGRGIGSTPNLSSISASSSASPPTTRKTTILPDIGTKTAGEEQIIPLYHVVLLNDDEHTYDYVIEMLGAIFCLPPDAAYRHAVEVDATGRTIVMTCELAQAEFGRDQIHAYGADPRMRISKGSMQARVEPATGSL